MRTPIPLAEIAIIFALAIVAVVGYKYSPLLLPKADLTIEPVAGCDLQHQACYAITPGGGRVELSFAPRPTPVVKPFQVAVTLSGITAQSVEVDFAGVSMNMGFNRKTLIAKGDGRFFVDAMLPVCISGRMAWLATVVVETSNHRIAVPFMFESSTAGN
ncbi:MAG: hypothetical protein WCK63_07965 [Betaproteobacteria bacterium]